MSGGREGDAEYQFFFCRCTCPPSFECAFNGTLRTEDCGCDCTNVCYNGGDQLDNCTCDCQVCSPVYLIWHVSVCIPFNDFAIFLIVVVAVVALQLTALCSTSTVVRLGW